MLDPDTLAPDEEEEISVNTSLEGPILLAMTFPTEFIFISDATAGRRHVEMVGTEFLDGFFAAEAAVAEAEEEDEEDEIAGEMVEEEEVSLDGLKLMRMSEGEKAMLAELSGARTKKSS